LFDFSGSDPPDELRLLSVHTAPGGVDGLEFQIATVVAPTVVLDDDMTGFDGLPRLTGFDAFPSGTYVVRFAWTISDVRVSDYGPDLLLEF
jgi:hypothetical protein